MDEGLRHSLGYTVLQEICPLNPLIKLLAIISIISKGKADDPITALRAETRKDPAALQFILRYHLAGKQTLQQIIMKLLTCPPKSRVGQSVNQRSLNSILTESYSCWKHGV